jgi:hypothetical protein
VDVIDDWGSGEDRQEVAVKHARCCGEDVPVVDASAVRGGGEKGEEVGINEHGGCGEDRQQLDVNANVDDCSEREEIYANSASGGDDEREDFGGNVVAVGGGEYRPVLDLNVDAKDGGVDETPYMAERADETGARRLSLPSIAQQQTIDMTRVRRRTKPSAQIASPFEATLPVRKQRMRKDDKNLLEYFRCWKPGKNRYVVPTF